MHFFTDDTWWGHMGWMMIFWVLGGVLVILLVVYMARFLATRSQRPGHRTRGEEEQDEAERILRERYARGEIDDREYQRRLDQLHSHP